MNAKILLRTMDGIDKLQEELQYKGFRFQLDEEKLEVLVERTSLETFSKIIKKYLNAPYNYVNVKFQEEKINFLIFPNKDFLIDSENADRLAKEWALSIGLSKPETEWTTFY